MSLAAAVDVPGALGRALDVVPIATPAFVELLETKDLVVQLLAADREYDAATTALYAAVTIGAFSAARWRVEAARVQRRTVLARIGGVP